MLSLFMTLKRQDGKADSKIPSILFVIVLVGGIFLGWKFGVPWWQNRKFDTAVSNIVKIDKFDRNEREQTEEDIKARILVSFRDITGDSLKAEQVQVKKESGRFQANIKYKRKITLPGMEPIIKTYEIVHIGN